MSGECERHCCKNYDGRLKKVNLNKEVKDYYENDELKYEEII